MIQILKFYFVSSSIELQRIWIWICSRKIQPEFEHCPLDLGLLVALREAHKGELGLVAEKTEIHPWCGCPCHCQGWRRSELINTSDGLFVEMNVCWDKESRRRCEREEDWSQPVKKRTCSEVNPLRDGSQPFFLHHLCTDGRISFNPTQVREKDGKH